MVLSISLGDSCSICGFSSVNTMDTKLGQNAAFSKPSLNPHQAALWHFVKQLDYLRVAQ